MPLELVKLYRIHAPLYPYPPPPPTMGNNNNQGVTMRVFTVLRPDQLAQVVIVVTVLYCPDNTVLTVLSCICLINLS